MAGRLDHDRLPGSLQGRKFIQQPDTICILRDNISQLARIAKRTGIVRVPDIFWLILRNGRIKD